VDVGQAILSALDENSEYQLDELMKLIGFSRSAILTNAKRCDLITVGWKAKKHKCGIKWCRVIKLKQPEKCTLSLLK
jgi:hypothetical protein